MEWNHRRSTDCEMASCFVLCHHVHVRETLKEDKIQLDTNSHRVRYIARRRGHTTIIHYCFNKIEIKYPHWSLFSFHSFNVYLFVSSFIWKIVCEVIFKVKIPLHRILLYLVVYVCVCALKNANTML